MAGFRLRNWNIILALGALLAGSLLAALLLFPDFAFAQALGQMVNQQGGGPRPTPFGMGAGPEPAGGIGGYILAQQAQFYRSLVQAVRAAKADGNATWMLAALSFAYGVFHAAGPGHGKAVISSYLLADGGTLRRGAALSLAAGMVQALVAILFVGLLAAILGATAASMAQAMNVIEIAAYGGIALFGLWLSFSKGRALLRALRGVPDHEHGNDCGCGDVHMPDPALIRDGGWKRATIAVVSAGARPCSGAILVLTFALAQGVFISGILAVIAMGLGTALTVTGIAALAVYGKRIAVRLAGQNGRTAQVLMRAVELLAAVLVMLFGLGLLTGYLESERLLPG
ncbi:nickel/cobalt transporter [Xanthobacter sp. TB0139]|uniref:nickel/cobalt transporter n=1 Tax=Xanthobacter sp. TB0139 TaxID=3459178 RepID=UPI00403934F1